MNFIEHLSNREKILLFALGILLIAFVGIQVLVRPAWTSLAADGVTLQNAAVSAQQVQMQEQAVSGTQLTLQKTLSEAAQSASFLFPSLDKPALQTFLVNIAEKSGFKVQAISISDPAAGSVQSDAASGVTASSGGALYNMKIYADIYGGKAVGYTAAASSGAATAATTSSGITASGTVSGTAVDLLTLSVNMQLSGNYDNAKKFVDAIMNTKKAVVVTAFSFAKSDKADSCTATLQLYAAPKLAGVDHTLDWAPQKPAGKSDLMK